MRWFQVCLPVSLVSICARSAFAQPSTLVEMAHARWNHGAQAFAKEDLQSALADFQAAYKSLPHPGLAQSLGVVEFLTHHYADAARHLTLALEKAKLPAEKRRVAKKYLEKALERVGTIVLDVDLAGADISIDGELVGRSPFPPEGWWLDEGEHVLTVHRDGYAEYTHTSAISAGQSVRLSLALEPLVESQAATLASSPSTQAFQIAGIPSSLESRPAAVPADKAAPSNGRAVALITGATLTMVSAGVGGYFLLRRGADEDQALELHGAVVAGVGRNGCASQPGADLCRQLADRYDAVD